MVAERNGYPARYNAFAGSTPRPSPRPSSSSAIGGSRPGPSSSRPTMASSAIGATARAPPPRSEVRRSAPSRGTPAPTPSMSRAAPSREPREAGAHRSTAIGSALPQRRPPLTPPPLASRRAPSGPTSAARDSEKSSVAIPTPKVGAPSSKARQPVSTPTPKSRARAVEEAYEDAEEDVEAPATPPFEDAEDEPFEFAEEAAEPEDEFPEEWADDVNGDAVDEVHTPNGEGEEELYEEPKEDAEDPEPEFEVADENEIGEDWPVDEDAAMSEPEQKEEPEPEEEQPESQMETHWGLLDAVNEDDNFFEEELLEEMSEPEEETKDGENKREEVEEVPEHLRDAVEGSERIKKMLEGADDPPAKRRRVDEYEAEREDRNLSEEKSVAMRRLLRDLRAEANSVCRYVIHESPVEEVQNVLRSKFVFKAEDRKSNGEQLNDQFIRLREREMVHGAKIDSCAAFQHRWKLKAEDDAVLRKLAHKELRYTIAHYDDKQALQDVVDEGKASEPLRGAAGGAPEKPGLLTLGRFNRLELISPSDKALVVGDANLTFSLLLAQHRKDLGHSGGLLATTFEQLATLKERYQEIEETIQTLHGLGAEVMHNVDCTKIGTDKRFEAMKEERVGAVYYNFPHAGAVRGFFDGHPFVRWRHENLMHFFFRNLRGVVKSGGSVKVASNQRAQGVRFSDIISAAAANEFIHVETVPFTEWTLRKYNRSYGDKRDETRRLKDGEIYAAQRANSDMVYCFTYAPSGEAIENTRVRYPPSKTHLLQATEGPLERLTGERKQRKVEELTQLFLSYVQGIHVG